MTNPLAPADAARIDQLVAVFTRIGEQRMKDLGLYNPALKVEAIGFRRVDDWLCGILVTPWFMNFMLLPPSAKVFQGVEPGAKRQVMLPRGEETFIVGEVEEVGSYAAQSIHSPMGKFADHAAAATAAWAVVESFFRPADGKPAEDCRFGWPAYAW